ncbi:TPA: hypothetical protein ACQWMF_001411 [Neisseria subflava]
MGFGFQTSRACVPHTPYTRCPVSVGRIQVSDLLPAENLIFKFSDDLGWVSTTERAYYTHVVGERYMTYSYQP